jgi:predicted phosphodiesterase
LVGYYFEPKKVVSIIRDLQFYSVKGNHEEILEVAKNDKDYLYHLVISKTYGKSYEYAIEELDKDDFGYLFGLPINLQVLTPQGKIHIEDFKLKNDIKWLMLGNTHIQMEKKVDALKIINPGSVGQARDGSGLAQWAILDTEKNQVEFQKTNYEKTTLMANIKKISPNFPKLWQSIGGT